MRILVTGGSGVVGVATVTELLRRGYTVRLFTRHAKEDARQWPERVEPHEGDVAEPDALRGAADGCAAVIAAAGIVTESGPEATFESVNVQGTRNVVSEAERAGVARLVYISSLGADTGESPYHVSKREGERIALGFAGDATVVRLANVYGPGDEVISLLVKMIRTLPVVPTIDGGADVFQPIWVGDAAAAIANCLERADLAGRSLDVAGPDTTCMNDLIERVCGITGRTPPTVPVTGGMVVLGAKLASIIGVHIPLDRGQITMLEEGNVIKAPAGNALDALLGVEPTPLERGLKLLADALPEQLPHEGVGALRRKRVWADIVGSTLTAEQLFERFRENFSNVTPWHMQLGVEPGSDVDLRAGATLTMALPVRGNIQVRVEELDRARLTLITLEGHPLAGAVRFLAESRGERTRFEVQVYDRAADVADWLVMRTVGQLIQLGTWRSIIRAVVQLSGGEAPDDVQHETESLDDEQAELVETWLEELVVQRKRDEAAATLSGAAPREASR